MSAADVVFRRQLLSAIIAVAQQVVKGQHSWITAVSECVHCGLPSRATMLHCCPSVIAHSGLTAAGAGAGAFSSLEDTVYIQQEIKTDEEISKRHK